MEQSSIRGLLAHQLKRFERLGIKEVEIRRARILGVCDVCRQDDGTPLLTEEAAQREPLPHAECTCRGSCRCTYVPTGYEEPTGGGYADLREMNPNEPCPGN